MFFWEPAVLGEHLHRKQLAGLGATPTGLLQRAALLPGRPYLERGVRKKGLKEENKLVQSHLMCANEEGEVLASSSMQLGGQRCPPKTWYCRGISLGVTQILLADPSQPPTQRWL